MKILYFAPIPYDGLKQRPQYLAEELAKEHEVIYVEPTISWMRFVLKGGERPHSVEYEIGPHLRVIRLNGTFSLHRAFEWFGGWLCFPERLQLRYLFRSADIVWIGYCPWYDVVRGYKGCLIYDKMDEDADLTCNRLLAKLSRRLEPQLIRRADRIFVTAQKFVEQMKAFGKDVVLLPNAVDLEQAERPKPAKTWDIGEKIFGYVGMISHWFDWEAIREILDADSRNRVVLVGPMESLAPNWERLECVGRVPKSEVGNWIASFDVCLYPFKKTPLIETINPVKIYEYLAANKPVIAVDSRETRHFGSLIMRYGNPEELKAALAEPWKSPFDEEPQRFAFIADNSWLARGNEIRKKLSEWR